MTGGGARKIDVVERLDEGGHPVFAPLLEVVSEGRLWRMPEDSLLESIDAIRDWAATGEKGATGNMVGVSTRRRELLRYVSANLGSWWTSNPLDDEAEEDGYAYLDNAKCVEILTLGRCK